MRQARLYVPHSRSLYKELNEMPSGSKPQEVKKLGDEILKMYRATGAESLGDDSTTTIGKAFSRYSGGRGCYIPIIWDTGCSKSIVSEEAVRALGSQINKLYRSLKIIYASGDSLSTMGTEDIFITTQVIDKRKRLPQCCVLRGNKQNPEILVSLEMTKKLKIVHETFGLQTIDDFLYNTGSTYYWK